jgi:hypothetical protein
VAATGICCQPPPRCVVADSAKIRVVLSATPTAYASSTTLNAQEIKAGINFGFGWPR